MVNKIEEQFEIHEQKTFLAMSLILFGPKTKIKMMQPLQDR